jgi:hypothetical protein
MLFLQAVDIRYRKDLGFLLENLEGTNGLVNDWEQVKNACNRLSKSHVWLGESSMIREEDPIQAKDPEYVEPKPIVEQHKNRLKKLR